MGALVKLRSRNPCKVQSPDGNRKAPPFITMSILKTIQKNIQIENTTAIFLGRGKIQILITFHLLDWRWNFWKDPHAFGWWVGPMYFDAGKFKD